MDKIPIEVLLKCSRKEVGELKSYIQELEYKLKETTKKLNALKSLSLEVNKEAKIELRKEELYADIKNKLKKLQKKYKELQKQHSAAITELVIIKNKIRNETL